MASPPSRLAAVLYICIFTLSIENGMIHDTESNDEDLIEEQCTDMDSVERETTEWFDESYISLLLCFSLRCATTWFFVSVQGWPVCKRPLAANDITS